MDMLQQVLLCALGAGAVLYFYVRLRLRYWKQRGILHEPPVFFWGHMKQVFRKRHVAAMLEQMYEKYKDKAPFVGFYAYLEPMVLVLDLQLVQHILHRDAELFAERNLYSDAVFDPLTKNLMQLDANNWQNLRLQVQYCYSGNRLAKLLPNLLRVTEHYKMSFQQKQMQTKVLVIDDLVDCWHIDVISKLVFGLEADTLSSPHSEFRVMAHSAWKQFNWLHAYLAFTKPSLSPFLLFTCFNYQSHKYFESLIKEQIKKRARSSADYNDFLQLFIETKYDENVKLRLDKEQILVEAFTFIAFGLGACNSTLTFCLYELAFHVQIQNEAREEIEKVLSKHKNELTLEAIEEMQYLKQILHETLRLYTPYPFVLRKSLTDFEIPNSVFMLAKGQRLIIPIAAIHRDKRLYPEELEFDPTRFEPSTRNKSHPMSFLPFGSWPRNCPARHFVELEMMVYLITLLRQYKFHICEETCNPLEFEATQFLLKPKESIKLRVERLEKVASSQRTAGSNHMD